MPEEKKTILDFGFDINLNRNPITKSPLVFDSFETANPSLLTSGPLLGNLTLADGNFQSGNFAAGSAGYQMTSTGYFEANTGVFRGDLSIGSGNNIILADPDDATWRLGVGNSSIASAPFRVDKDGNAYGIGFKTLENFTAGEDITMGNVVCLKNSYNSALITIAGSCNSAAPDTNYDGNTELYVGTSNWTTFLKIPLDTIPTNFQKAELVLYSTVYFAETLNLQMTSADAGTAWTEANLTWNNKPESFFDSDDPGGQYTQAIDAGGITIIDITQMIKLWKNSQQVNFGLKIDVSAPSNAPRFASDDYTIDTDKRPFIRWLTYDESDGKVYKASSNDYNLSRYVLGIASTTVVSGTTLPVQRTGNSDVYVGSSVGGKRYLDTTAGSLNVATPAGLPRVAMVGFGTTTGGAFFIDIKDQHLFIETIGPFNIQASDTIHTIMVHPDASNAIVEYIMNRATTYSAQGNFHIDISGQSAVEIQHPDYSSPTNKEFNTTWVSASQYITINSESAATSGSDYLTYKIHLYT